MILTDLLLETFDIVEFMENNGFAMRWIGGATEYLTTCPWCYKQEHCGINTEKKIFGCYKCHQAGNFMKLIQKIIKKNFFDTVEFLKGNLDVRRYNIAYIDNLLKEIKPQESVESKIRPVKLPEGYISLAGKRIPYLDSGRKFPIPDDQVRYYKIGVCLEGKYRNRLIICDVNENQEPIYWIARAISKDVPKRWKVLNPDSTEVGVGSGDLLFNYFLAKNYDTAIITEGLFDSLYVGNNGVASYGEGLKKTHIYWLLKGGFKDVVLLYDADVSDERLEESAILLSQYFNVKVCKLPVGDPDEYPKEVLGKFISESKLFKPSRLTKLVLDLA